MSGYWLGKAIGIDGIEPPGEQTPVEAGYKPIGEGVSEARRVRGSEKVCERWSLFFGGRSGGGPARDLDSEALRDGIAESLRDSDEVLLDLEYTGDASSGSES